MSQLKIKILFMHKIKIEKKKTNYTTHTYFLFQN
jgi:hypothetical protein